MKITNFFLTLTILLLLISSPSMAEDTTSSNISANGATLGIYLRWCELDEDACTLYFSGISQGFNVGYLESRSAMKESGGKLPEFFCQSKYAKDSSIIHKDKFIKMVKSIPKAQYNNLKDMPMRMVYAYLVINGMYPVKSC